MLVDGTIIMDACVGVKLVIPEEDSPAAEALFSRLVAGDGPPIQVPDHFFAECANGVRRAVQRDCLSAETASIAIHRLCLGEFEVTPTRDLAPEALVLARAEGISLYDALYVALSDLTGAPLVTADRRLFDRLRGTPHRVVGLWEIPAA